MIRRLGRNNRVIVVSSLFFLAGGILGILDNIVEGLPVCLDGVAFLCFGVITIYNIIYFWQSIPKPRMRWNLLIALVLLLLWESTVPLEVAFYGPYPEIAKYIWYSQYTMTLFVPNFILVAVLCGGKQYDYKPSWLVNSTFFISGILSLLILTNNVHGLAFSIVSYGGTTDSIHTYGIVYFIAMIWMLVLYGICGTLMFKNIRVESDRRYIWIVVVSLFMVVIYIAWWIMGRPLFPKLYDMYSVPEFALGILILSLELCIRNGLIRSNVNAQELIEESQFAISIEDEHGIKYSTPPMDNVSAEKKNLASREVSYIDADHRLHERSVLGGSVYWIEDIGAVNKTLRDLEDIRSRLEQENEIMVAENDILARRAKADEGNRIYTILMRDVRKQLDKIEEFLNTTPPDDPAFNEELAKACVYKAYVKRFCNLMLLAQENKMLNIFELDSALKESTDYLKLTNIDTTYKTVGSNMDFFEAHGFVDVYSIFEEIVEYTIDDIDSIEVELHRQIERYSLCLKLFGGNLKDIVAFINDLNLSLVAYDIDMDVKSDDVMCEVVINAEGGFEDVR